MTHPVDDGSFQYRHCLKKKAYGSEALAREIIASLARKKGIQLWTYECSICHCWHLTSRPVRERQAG